MFSVNCMISIMMVFHARQCLFFMQDSVHEYEHEFLSHEYMLIQLTFHIVAIKYRATSFGKFFTFTSCRQLYC